MGLHQPLPVEFVLWLTLALQEDLGRSFGSGLPVLDLVKARLPATLELAIAATLLTILIAIPAGAAPVHRRDRHQWVEHAIADLAEAAAARAAGPGDGVAHCCPPAATPQAATGRLGAPRRRAPQPGGRVGARRPRQIHLPLDCPLTGRDGRRSAGVLTFPAPLADHTSCSCLRVGCAACSIAIAASPRPAASGTGAPMAVSQAVRAPSTIGPSRAGVLPVPHRLADVGFRPARQAQPARSRVDTMERRQP